MAKVPRRFVNETLWPEFQEFSATLRIFLSEITERVVSQVICPDSSEAEEVEAPRQLPSSVGQDQAEAMGMEDQDFHLGTWS
jgi:hypothetical protein